MEKINTKTKFNNCSSYYNLVIHTSSESELDEIPDRTQKNRL